MADMPLAVVLDIDGTIIGEIIPQVVEWQLVKKYRIEYMRQYRAFLVDSLRSALTRPGLADLVNGIRANFPRVEFFIYTASEHKWANFVVPCIEAALGVEFCRPILTRNYMVVNRATGAYQKSLVKVMPAMNRSLKKKGYAEPLTLKQCILVDNNSTLVKEEASRLVMCPSYKYMLYQDVLRFLPVLTVREHLGDIVQFLVDAEVLPPPERKLDVDAFYALYYEQLGRHMAVRYKTNVVRDRMWATVHKALFKMLSQTAPVHAFKENFIKSLNKKLARKTE